MFIEELKITKDRIPILIGKNGLTRRQIEHRTQTRINVDSIEGDVKIYSDEPFKNYIAKLVINAIGRGFNPEIAYYLLREEIGLEIIYLPDIIGKNKTKLIRQRSRLIGTQGKSKKTIEDLTNTSICIYGKTVAIIGPFDKILTARKAIEKLVQGSNHGNVYRWLETNH